VHIKLGIDARSIPFDSGVNIKSTFGPYSILRDRHLQVVPLKSSGESLQPLSEGGLYLVEVNGLGYDSKLAAQAKRQTQQKFKTRSSSSSVDVSKLITSDDYLKKLDAKKQSMIEQRRAKKERKSINATNTTVIAIQVNLDSQQNQRKCDLQHTQISQPQTTTLKTSPNRRRSFFRLWRTSTNS